MRRIGITLTGKIRWMMFRKWRYRRLAMQEFKQLAQCDEARLLGSDLNPLHLATQALEANDTAVASHYWEEAQRHIPDYVLESERSVAMLLGLKRFDELELLMQRGHKKWPRRRLYLSGFAQLHQHRGQYAQAVFWWRKVLRRFPVEKNAYINGAACLRALNRHKEAVVLLNTAVRYCSEDEYCWASLAITNEELEDWSAALQCWDHLAYGLGQSRGYLGGARVCEALGDLEGALQRLARGRVKYPNYVDLIIATARLAERVRPLSEAICCWSELRRSFPYQDLGYREEARCLTSAGRVEEAKAILAQASEQIPNFATLSSSSGHHTR